MRRECDRPGTALRRKIYNMQEDRILSARRLAGRLGVSQSYVYHLVSRGAPCYRLKNRLVFYFPSVAKFIRANNLLVGPHRESKPNDCLKSRLGTFFMTKDEALSLAKNVIAEDSVCAWSRRNDGTRCWQELSQSEKRQLVRFMIRTHIGDTLHSGIIVRGGTIRDSCLRRLAILEAACASIRVRYPHMGKVIEELTIEFEQQLDEKRTKGKNDLSGYWEKSA